LCAYNAVLQPGDTILALCSKVGGGHHTYGLKDANNDPTSLYSKSYNFEYYGVTEDGMIDYEAAYRKALEVRPKLIIAGASTYPREIDWKKFRKICDESGAIMMADVAHGFGLKIAGVNDHPFLYADIVTASTSKSMRGPRAGVIYCRKQYAKQMDTSVFPGVMGAPQNSVIGALAMAFKICKSQEYKEYAERVIENCQTICYELKKKGNKIVTGGTDTNIMMWDIREFGANAKTMMTIGEACNVQF
jgi:glycine hydroxymethyltransferase